MNERTMNDRIGFAPYTITDRRSGSSSAILTVTKKAWGGDTDCEVRNANRIPDF